MTARTRPPPRLQDASKETAARESFAWALLRLLLPLFSSSFAPFLLSLFLSFFSTHPGTRPSFFLTSKTKKRAATSSSASERTVSCPSTPRGRRA